MLSHSIFNSGKLIGGKTFFEWQKLFTDHMLSIDADFDPGHRIDHVQRVTKSAIELAEQEGADLAIVLPAAMLHDTKPVGKFDKDRAKASYFSSENTEQLLMQWGYPSEYLPAIKHAILTHSFSADVKPETLEAKVVQDADRLDALGAIGIARTMAVGFKHGNPLYLASEPFPVHRDADDNKHIIDHFYVKLFKLPESLHTRSAKLEAVRRIESMESYLQALAREIGVNYLSYQDYITSKETKRCYAAP